MAYFIDASAMLEIAKGNPNFEQFLNEELTTSIHSLHELHSLLLKETSKENAENIFSKFRHLSINHDDSTLLKASHLMHESEVKISNTDAIGFVLAMEKDCKFLTSNESLKSLNNTLFVK